LMIFWQKEVYMATHRYATPIMPGSPPQQSKGDKIV